MEQKFEKMEMENGRLSLSAPTIISILILICPTDMIWRDITKLKIVYISTLSLCAVIAQSGSVIPHWVCSLSSWQVVVAMMFPMFNKIVCLLVLVQLAISTAQKEIYDPRGIFCGKMSCYDVLNITRKSPPREVKRAYRRLSLENHPDKNKADNATKIFKRIAKAYEVLIGNESRPLFDYYLDHPRDYFKVSGHHYFRNLPKSDVRLVIFLVACLLSWFFFVMQNQKYEAAMKSIKTAMANVSGASQPKQITDLQNRAAALYEDYIKKGIIKQTLLCR